MTQANDNNDLVVYHYYWHFGRAIPNDVQKLIVDSTAVEEIHGGLCCWHIHLREVIFPEGSIRIGRKAFVGCSALQKVKIPSTIEIIGDEAFNSCTALQQIDFTQPSSLREIGRHSFDMCHSLERITPPSTFRLIGLHSFMDCYSLIVVNLSQTQVTEIPQTAFKCCESLQSVSLPNSLERIMENAFWSCFALVTVEISSPVNHVLNIQKCAFDGCKSLCNFQIPSGSILDERAFGVCKLLRKCFGQESSNIVQGLVHRFDEHPVHKLCYHASSTTPDQLSQCVINNQREAQAPIDQFGKSPFHVLFSSVEPRRDLLEVLLERYPGHVLNVKDASGKLALDYLLTNWTEETKEMTQMALQSCVFNRLERWGRSLWRDAMVLRVNNFLREEDKEQRSILYKGVGDTMERFEARGSFALLEMALWKNRLEGATQIADRGQVRLSSGSDFVIPNVLDFLKDSPLYSSSDGASASDDDD